MFRDAQMDKIQPVDTFLIRNLLKVRNIDHLRQDDHESYLQGKTQLKRLLLCNKD